MSDDDRKSSLTDEQAGMVGQAILVATGYDQHQRLTKRQLGHQVARLVESYAAPPAARLDQAAAWGAHMAQFIGAHADLAQIPRAALIRLEAEEAWARLTGGAGGPMPALPPATPATWTAKS